MRTKRLSTPFMCLLFFCSISYGKKLSPVSASSTIIAGDILSNQVGFAGGFVPITETKIVVKRIFKDIHKKIQINDTVKLINYGGFVNGDEYFLEGEKPVYFNENRKVILCLKKYFNHFKIINPSDIESVAYILNDKVYTYDTLSISDSASSSNYKKYIARSNIERKKTFSHVLKNRNEIKPESVR